MSPKTAKPLLLYFFGIVFLLIPFVNYVAKANLRQIPLGDVAAVLATFGWMGQALLTVSFLVGIGVLMVARWGWWLFVVYAPLFALYDLYLFATNPIAYNLGALAQTVLAFAGMGYFLRRDISAPFFSASPRGFRLHKRYPVEHPLVVDGIARTTKDLSERGCFIAWPDSGVQVGAKLRVSLALDGYAIDIGAEVRRVDAGGVGVLFDDNELVRRTLKVFLSAHRT